MPSSGVCGSPNEHKRKRKHKQIFGPCQRTKNDGGLGKVPKDLEKTWEEIEISGKIKTIQTIALLILARIRRRVLET